MQDGWNKCPYCGTQLNLDGKSNNNKGKKPNVILIVVVAIIVVAIVGRAIGKEKAGNKDQKKEEAVHTVTEEASESMVDIEYYIGKPLDDILVKGEFSLAIGAVYCLPDNSVIIDPGNGDTVIDVVIDENYDFGFHGITYGTNFEKVKKLLADTYNYDFQKANHRICFWTSPYYEIGGYIDLDNNDNVESMSIQMNFEKEYLHYVTEREMNGDYIIFESAFRELTDSDIENSSVQELEMAVDEIYARKGMKFKDVDRLDYFLKKSWYEGTVKEEDFTDSMFSDIEKYNIDFLKRKIDEINKESKEGLTGIYEDSSTGMKLVITQNEEEQKLYSFQCFEADGSLLAYGDDCPIVDGYIDGGDFYISKNLDGSLSISSVEGEKQGVFEKVS